MLVVLISLLPFKIEFNEKKATQRGGKLPGVYLLVKQQPQ